MRKNRTKTHSLSMPLRLIYERMAVFLWGGLAVLLVFATAISSDRVNSLRLHLVDSAAPFFEITLPPLRL